MSCDPIILDGLLVAKNRLNLLKKSLQNASGVMPKLCIISIGNDSASKIYIQKKIAAAKHASIDTLLIHRASCTQQELHHILDQVAADPIIHAMILQLPLPKNLCAFDAINHIHPEKDADGLHPLNMGRMLMGQANILPCTPQGILHLLEFYDLSVEKKNIVVLGRSLIVGTPLSIALTQKGGTVTLCHSKSKDIPATLMDADIIISATGQKNIVHYTHLPSGCIVIDVGIIRTPQGIRGDIIHHNPPQHVQAYTPVPGGVGPMTVISLLENTFTLYRRIHGL